MDEREITARELAALCERTGWKLQWDEEYFDEERTIIDIFYDLLEPQGYGFWFDWRYDAEDVEAGAKRCLADLPVSVVGERFVTRSMKPFNYEPDLYRVASLVAGERRVEVVYTTGEPDYLLHEILRVGGVQAQTFAFLNTGEDNYCFVLLPASLQIETLLPEMELEDLLSASVAAYYVAATRPARQKYFYVPLLTSNLRETPQDNSQSFVDVLTYQSRSGARADAYASRVLPGQTLAEAVGADLRQDFGYEGLFKISDYHLLDTARDKAGHELPRLLVHVEVEPFDTADLEVLGCRLTWETVHTSQLSQGYTLGFGLH